MGKNLSEILLEPIITEKSSALSQQNKYTFEVAKCASKTSIKHAFEQLFPGRKVLAIQTSSLKGHKRRTKVKYTVPKDSKKAIVTASGDRLEYFPEVS